jgi:peptidoglycan/xylan/chitin deacetylase (PgdA/CDA1 family)
MKRNLIINFHIISDSVWFEKVLLVLKSKYQMVDLEYFESAENLRKRNRVCHLTFDDGDRTFYKLAFPLLVKHRVPATIFVSPKIAVNRGNFWFQEIKGYDQNIMKKIISRELSISPGLIENERINAILKCMPLSLINKIISLYQTETGALPKEPQNMTTGELLEVERSGLVTIGAHTLHHPILKNETNSDCQKEISGSVTGLQELLGHGIKYFAYPNGIPGVDFGERELEILKQNNIRLALSTESRFVGWDEDPLALPRMGLTYGGISFIRIKLALGSNWEKMKSLLNFRKSGSDENIVQLRSVISKLVTR